MTIESDNPVIHFDEHAMAAWKEENKTTQSYSMEEASLLGFHGDECQDEAEKHIEEN